MNPTLKDSAAAPRLFTCVDTRDAPFSPTSKEIPLVEPSDLVPVL